MPITFPCPHCGQELTAPDEAAGQAGKCRFCNATVQAPLSSEAPPQLIQPGIPTPATAEDADNPYAAPPTYHVGFPSGPIGQVKAGLIFGEAWQVTRENWGILIGAIVLGHVVFFLAMLLPMVLLMPRDSAPYDDQILGMGRFMASMFVVGIAVSPVFLGVYSMVDELLTRGQTSIATLFSPFRRYGRVLGTLLLISLIAFPIIAVGMALTVPVFWMDFDPTISLPTKLVGHEMHLIIGWLLLCAVSAYLMLGLVWAPFEVLDRGAAPLDAIRESWRAVRGKRLAVFGTLALFGILNLIGSYCCITALFTLPLVSVGMVITYRQLRGLECRIV